MYEQAFYLALMFSALPLIVSMIVGLVISVLQAATQIQESTLVFVPKLAIVIVVLFFAGPWMFSQILDFSQEVFSSVQYLE